MKFNAFKAVSTVAIATALAKVLGFVREMTMAALFGTGMENDAFLMAFTLPNIIFGMIAGALATTLIPVFTEVKSKDGAESAQKFINNVITISFIFTFALSIIGIIFAEKIIEVIAAGFPTETKGLTVQLFRILVPLITIMSLVAVFTGYLQANFHFAMPAMVSIPMNVIILSFLWYFSSKWGIVSLAWGYTIGTSAQVLMLLIPAIKQGFKYKVNFMVNDPRIKQVGVLIVPVVIGTAVTQINALVDRFLASGLCEGSISALHFANKLVLFPHGVFILALSTVAYPTLSRTVASDDQEEFKRVLKRWINIMLMFVIPMTVGFIALQKPVTQLVYERGSFNSSSTALTAVALQYYSLGLPAFGLRDLLSRAFYSIQDTKTPMINGVIAVIINIVLNIILIKPLGHGGLALATSISGTVTVLLLIWSLHRKSLLEFNTHQLIYLSKFTIASLIMGFVVSNSYKYIYSLLNKTVFGLEISGIITILLGTFVYFVVLALLFLPEIYVKKISIMQYIKTNKF